MKLFLDIETVPNYYSTVAHEIKDFEIFRKKFKSDVANLTVPEICQLYLERAALYAEFGRVVCVSLGYVSGEEIKLKSFCGDSEFQILTDTASALQKATSIVAHNGKDFDYPFLCRRMIVNAVPLPDLLRIQNLKPWEIKLEDTIEMWKFGQFSYKASLESLCNLFEIPSPKTDMSGADVAHVFYVDKDYERISKYCEGDVSALINVYRTMQYQDILT
ncbi:MAG TPA: ribonuclease H-like domain-containing protein [Ohtaekwangia sp.]|nr:ribonuclease H-like domain-containing protein [Ohtaekwangia sp.]